MQTKKKRSITHIKNYNTNLVDRSSISELEPFIFSNNLNWPALNLWSPSFFKERYGNLEFKVTSNLPDKICPYFYNANSYRKHMQFSEFIDLLETNKNCYLAQEDMGAFKDLEKDYDFHEIIPSNSQNKNVSINLWLGANTHSGLHFDHYDNFLVQVFGTKKVFLIPAKDAGFLYPIPSNFFKSPVNPMDPDLNAFPKFKNARVFEGELRAGDILFIPKGWYHYIYSPYQSISLNCWYGPVQTSKDLLLTFYRSGWRTWLITLKDFIWYGLLSRPFEPKLYSSPPIGRVVYEWLKERARWKLAKSSIAPQ